MTGSFNTSVINTDMLCDAYEVLAMAKLKTRTGVRTRRPSSKNMKTKRPVQEDIEVEEDENLEEDVQNRAEVKPELHAVWPILMVTSILSCIGIPFVGQAEQVLIGSIAGCFALLSVFMIFKFERELHNFYVRNPDQTPANKRKRLQEQKKERRAQKRRGGKRVRI